MASVRLAQAAMRVRFEAYLEGPDPNALQSAGEEALAEIERIEGELSAYDPFSDLYRVNAQGADHPVRVLATTLAFLERARALCRRTGGAFDPTVGPLLRLWGLTGEAPAAEPDAAALAAARDLVGMERCVTLDEEAGTVALTRAGVALDPGALGKGWALDRAAALLRELGVARALLHGGTSSVIAIGGPWIVAIAHPEAGIVGRVELTDRALGVSGAHGKSVTVGGIVYGHVIDPRTGRPVTGAGLAAVSTESAADSDALSTALLVTRDPEAAWLPDEAGALVVRDGSTQTRSRGHTIHC